MGSTSDANITIYGACIADQNCTWDASSSHFNCTIDPYDDYYYSVFGEPGYCTINATALRGNGCYDDDGIPNSTMEVRGALYNNRQEPNGEIYNPDETVTVNVYLTSDHSPEGNISGAVMTGYLTDSDNTNHILVFSDLDTDGIYTATYTFQLSDPNGYWNLSVNSSKQFYENRSTSWSDVVYLNQYPNITLLESPDPTDRDSGSYQVSNISINVTDPDESSGIPFVLNITNMSLRDDTGNEYIINITDNCTRTSANLEQWVGFCLWNPPNTMTDEELGPMDVEIRVYDGLIYQTSNYKNNSDLFNIDDINVTYNTTAFGNTYYSNDNVTFILYADYANNVSHAGNDSNIYSGTSYFELHNESHTSQASIPLNIMSAIANGEANATFNLSCINEVSTWHVWTESSHLYLHEEADSVLVNSGYNITVSPTLTSLNCWIISNWTHLQFYCNYKNIMDNTNISGATVTANMVGGGVNCIGPRTLSWNATEQWYEFICEANGCVGVTMNTTASKSCHFSQEQLVYAPVAMADDVNISAISAPGSVKTLTESLFYVTVNASKDVAGITVSVGQAYDSDSAYGLWNTTLWNIGTFEIISNISAGENDTVNISVSSVRTQPPGNYSFPVNVSWNSSLCNVGLINTTVNLTIMNDPWAEFNVTLNSTEYEGDDMILLNGTIINRGNMNITADADVRAEIFDRYLNSYNPAIDMNCTTPQNTDILPILSNSTVYCTYFINNTIPSGAKKVEIVYVWGMTHSEDKLSDRTISDILSFGVESTLYGIYMDTQAKDIATVQVPVIIIDRFGRTSIQYISVGTTIN